MTRRIAIAILLTVWATLVVGGMVAYWTTRSVLVADLDDSVTKRAALVLEAHGMASAGADGAGREGSVEDEVTVFPHPEDDLLLRDELGRTIGRLEGRSHVDPDDLVIVRGAFNRLADGQLVRTVVLRVNDEAGSYQVVCRAPAAGVERALNRLAVSLLLVGGAGGLAGAVVAVWVSRLALRPLRGTADAIGGIDERKLDRRIDPATLPPELKPVAERLNEMLGRLEQAFAQRRQFLADASHELRTPVAALVTTLEIALRRPRDAAELTRTLQSCLSDARMLRRLVSALMEQARAEASGGSGPSRRDASEVVDAADFLAELARVAEGLAAGRGVRVVRSLNPVQGLSVRTKPERLRSVVMNLLSNAVEYNRPGGTVELTARADDDDTLEVAVRDTGPGIAPEHLPHLFQPFYRADPARSSHDGADVPGPPGGGGGHGAEDESQHLGLGLFLVESHVKAMGGECRVESELGVGTVFRVRLPGAVVASAAASSEVDAAALGAERSARPSPGACTIGGGGGNAEPVVGISTVGR